MNRVYCISQQQSTGFGKVSGIQFCVSGAVPHIQHYFLGSAFPIEEVIGGLDGIHPEDSSSTKKEFFKRTA